MRVEPVTLELPGGRARLEPLALRPAVEPEVTLTELDGLHRHFEIVTLPGAFNRIHTDRAVFRGDSTVFLLKDVAPGARLSLQKHYHRAEHWVVVNGTALVTRGEEQMLVYENQSVYIPMGTVHRLENPGKVPLYLIEVQSGGYLGEDDIVRFEDRYKR